MGFLEKLKSLTAYFESNKLDVSARFEFTREAISGTMSKFRSARDIKTGKIVGLKILDSEKTAAFEERFKQLNKPSEGEIAMKIKSPRVVETYEYGDTVSGQQYILMEFIEGPGLNTLIQNCDESLVGKRVELIRQMAEAIDAVHKAGFIHRDVCPRNFIVTADMKTLKLIDFGLTVPNEREYRMPGNRTGTPLYMAPEIVRRRSTDERVDIFALGVTSYRLLTWEFPWPAGETSGKAALAHDTQKPTDIFSYRPKLNRVLGEAIMKCIEPEPGERPASTEQFLQMIRGVTSEEEAA
ncbi:MAG: serine/threonine-protein kinase [Pirellulaceae bacterium]